MQSNNTVRPTTRLKLDFDPETGRFLPLEMPGDGDIDTQWHFQNIGYGFQIIDAPEEMFSECVYTVLLSHGQHGRTEVIILLTGVDGTMKTLGKGSIPDEDDNGERRLREWIELHINREFDANAKSRAEAETAIRAKTNKIFNTKYRLALEVAESISRDELALVLAQMPVEILTKLKK